MADQRTKAVRRALRLYDGGASLEHAIGEAYNSGHIHGMGMKAMAETEVDLIESVRLLTHYQVEVLRDHVSPQLAELAEYVREEQTEEKPEPGSPTLGAYAHGFD